MFDAGVAGKDTAPDVGQDKADLGINHLRQPSQAPLPRRRIHTSARLALGTEQMEKHQKKKTLQADLVLASVRGGGRCGSAKSRGETATLDKLISKLNQVLIETTAVRHWADLGKVPRGLLPNKDCLISR